jgi:hypothetical protein
MKMHHRLQLVLLVATLLSCTCAPATPPRPAGLPAEAMWVGGPDGGVFIQLKRQDDPGPPTYTGTVYHSDGSVWYEGGFMLEPAGGKVDPADKSQFAGWDGTQILLQDGRALVARRGG